MADTVLPKAQAVALLKKLATDDEFRTLYRSNPGRGMLAAGVPQAVVGSLPASHTAPLRALADKSAFASALDLINADAAECHVCLNVPTIQLNFGKK